MIRRRERADGSACTIEVIDVVRVTDHRLSDVSHGHSARGGARFASQMGMAMKNAVGAMAIDRFGELIASEEREYFAPLSEECAFDR